MMKVKIKKYWNYFGPYQLVEKIFFWTKKNGEFPDWVDEIGDKFANSWIGKWYADRAQKIADEYDKNRAYVVIDDYDVWNMDHTLAFVILPMLKKLKDSKHGAPFVDIEDRPEHLVPKKESDPLELDEFHFDAWDWVMDEMIFAFDSKVGEGQDWEDQFHVNGFDVEGYKTYYARIANGFRLFGKFYNGLWD